VLPAAVELLKKVLRAITKACAISFNVRPASGAAKAGSLLVTALVILALVVLCIYIVSMSLN
jgi:hypothetical protein